MGFVKPGQGPAARADLADPGFAYNGEGGGRVFTWDRKGLFGWFLNQLGYAGRDLSKCSERQCMDALLATSGKLRLFPMETAELQPFAGPQCYPHLSEKARLNANSKKPATSGEAASPDIVRARQQLQDCWLKCHDCGSWRLVDRCSFPALDPEAFAADPENQEDVKWRIYLEGAEGRNKSFLQRRRQQERAMRPSDADEGLESDADSDEALAAASPEPAPLEQGAACDMSGSSTLSVCNSGATSDSDTDGGSHALVPGGVLQGLGSRGGGLTRGDVAALGRLDPQGVGSGSAPAFAAEEAPRGVHVLHARGSAQARL